MGGLFRKGYSGMNIRERDNRGRGKRGSKY
jgi:hypothetical protein